MINQKSFLDSSSVLYLVATPIGNLKDFSTRAVETLQSVDMILCEDTRTSKVLLDCYDIHKPCTSYHEFNKDSKESYILSLLQEGKNLALISDAGTPVISDPGYEIVKKAREEGYRVVPIPGASAFLNALIVSGFSPKPFLYYGFLSSKPSTRRTELEELKNHRETMIFYEAPHRIKETLKDMKKIFGNRNVFLAREITKKFEEFLWATLEELEDYEPKGEYVIVIEGNKEEVQEENVDYIECVKQYIEEGYTNLDAIKEVAKKYHIKKSDLYKKFYENE